MSDLISETRPVARKDRRCMAADFIRESGGADWLTFGERRQVVQARRHGWKIKAGEQYVRQAVKCCGDFGVFVAIPALHAICLKYDLYGNDC